MKKLLVFIIIAAALLALVSCKAGSLIALDPEYKLMESKSLGTVYTYGVPEHLSPNEHAELIVHSGKAVLIYTDEDRHDEEDDGYYLVDTRVTYYSVRKNNDGTLTLKALKFKEKTDVVGDYPEEYKEESGYGVWEEYVAENDDDAEAEIATVTLNESDKTFEVEWN